MQTGWASMKLGWVAYIIPFLFAYSPTLLLQGEWQATMIDVATACVGVYFISTAFVGYATKEMNPAMRVLLAALGLGAMLPAMLASWVVFANIACIVIGVLYLFQNAAAARKAIAGAAD